MKISYEITQKVLLYVHRRESVNAPITITLPSYLIPHPRHCNNQGFFSVRCVALFDSTFVSCAYVEICKLCVGILWYDVMMCTAPKEECWNEGIHRERCMRPLTSDQVANSRSKTCNLVCAKKEKLNGITNRELLWVCCVVCTWGFQKRIQFFFRSHFDFDCQTDFVSLCKHEESIRRWILRQERHFYFILHFW